MRGASVAPARGGDYRVCYNRISPRGSSRDSGAQCVSRHLLLRRLFLSWKTVNRYQNEILGSNGDEYENEALQLDIKALRRRVFLKSLMDHITCIMMGSVQLDDN